MESLYRHLLGAEFDSLPEALRRFHSEPSGGRARGSLCVRRGNGWLRNGLATLARLPAAGERVPVELRVEVEGARERWIRHFDGRRMETRQWAWKGLLIEAMGPLRFGYRVQGRDGEMRLEFARAWLYAIQLPPALAVRPLVILTGRPDGWKLDVQIEAPLLGLLASYQGEMRLL